MNKETRQKLDEKLQKYYANQKLIEKYEFEISELSSNETKLMEMKKNISNDELLEESNQISQKINDTIKKKISKELKIIEIKEESSQIDYAIGKLGDEDKQLIELKYKNAKLISDISKEMHMSKSTASRKINKILIMIEEIID